MKTQIAKWGNSLAVRIPVETARRLRLRKGSRVECSELSGSLVLTPAARSEVSLSDMLEAITDENLHRETPTGNPRGAESW